MKKIKTGKKRKNNRGTIVLGICGSAAAYKGCALASALTNRGWCVKCVLTAAGSRFMTPLSLQAVTGKPCYHEMFQDILPEAWDMHHLSLSREAVCIVVAPASADLIARCAQGRASDLLSSVILAARVPVIMAPAMNTNMYTHPLTQRNIRLLADIGYRMIGPEQGRLACGDDGTGRMSEPERIAKEIETILKKKQRLST